MTGFGDLNLKFPLIFAISVFMLRLHFPRAPYDLFVYNFRTVFSGIVGG